MKSEDFEYSAKPYIDHIYDALLSLLELECINHHLEKSSSDIFSNVFFTDSKLLDNVVELYLFKGSLRDWERDRPDVKTSTAPNRQILKYSNLEHVYSFHSTIRSLSTCIRMIEALVLSSAFISNARRVPVLLQ